MQFRNLEIIKKKLKGKIKINSIKNSLEYKREAIKNTTCLKRDPSIHINYRRKSHESTEVQPRFELGLSDFEFLPGYIFSDFCHNSIIFIQTKFKDIDCFPLG